MVGAPAAADAIARARRLPRLRVGLHVVLLEGRPVLPRERLPNLVDASGCFRRDMIRLAFDVFARRVVRRELAAEIEAQFKAYCASGLALDHVDAHKHFHLHPTITRALLAIGRRYGMRGLRVPHEPMATLIKVDASARRDYLPKLGRAPWAASLRARARRAGLMVPDAVFGVTWSGAMNEARLSGLLAHLPDGCSEIYLHPAASNDFVGHAPGYRYVDELAALTAPSVIAAARGLDIALGGYSDFVRQRR